MESQKSYTGLRNLGYIIRQRPQAYANISGSDKWPGTEGKVFFYQTGMGVIVAAEIHGLPHEEGICGEKVFGFHIHGGESCTGNVADPFADAGTHYNPKNCGHPDHAGDLPPLFGNKGYALQVVLTDRFVIEEVIGKTVIVHSGPDDFTSQPAGNAGEKIACGVIRFV